MRTAHQIEASRLNGARSRGPVTDAGKRKSSRNSRRHGLYAKTVQPEDIPACVTEAIATFRTGLEAEYPRGNTANFAGDELIDSVVQAYGYLRQIVALETTVMNREIARQRLAHPEESDLMLQALAFKRLSDETGTLRLIDRLETRLFSHFEMAIDRLRFLESLGFGRQCKFPKTSSAALPEDTNAEKVKTRKRTRERRRKNKECGNEPTPILQQNEEMLPPCPRTSVPSRNSSSAKSIRAKML